MAKMLILIEEDEDSTLAFRPRKGGKNIWINGIQKILKLACHTRQSKGFIKIIFFDKGHSIFEKKLSDLPVNPFKSVETLLKPLLNGKPANAVPIKKPSKTLVKKEKAQEKKHAAKQAPFLRSLGSTGNSLTKNPALKEAKTS